MKCVDVRQSVEQILVEYLFNDACASDTCEKIVEVFEASKEVLFLHIGDWLRFRLPAADMLSFVEEERSFSGGFDA